MKGNNKVTDIDLDAPSAAEHVVVIGASLLLVLASALLL